MSDAKKCDRCGKFYTLDISNEEDDVAAMGLVDKYGRMTTVKDLCRECRRELTVWLSIKKENVAND